MQVLETLLLLKWNVSQWYNITLTDSELFIYECTSWTSYHPRLTFWNLKSKAYCSMHTCWLIYNIPHAHFIWDKLIWGLSCADTIPFNTQVYTHQMGSRLWIFDSVHWRVEVSFYGYRSLSRGLLVTGMVICDLWVVVNWGTGIVLKLCNCLNFVKKMRLLC